MVIKGYSWLFRSAHSTWKRKDEKTIREVLREAFQHMFDLEQEMLQMYEKMGDASDEEMAALMEDTAEIQTILEHQWIVLQWRLRKYRRLQMD